MNPGFLLIVFFLGVIDDGTPSPEVSTLQLAFRDGCEGRVVVRGGPLFAFELPSLSSFVGVSAVGGEKWGGRRGSRLKPLSRSPAAAAGDSGDGGGGGDDDDAATVLGGGGGGENDGGIIHGGRGRRKPRSLSCLFEGAVEKGRGD